MTAERTDSKIARCKCGFPAKLKDWWHILTRNYQVECDAGHRGGIRASPKNAIRAWNRAQSG